MTTPQNMWGNMSPNTQLTLFLIRLGDTSPFSPSCRLQGDKSGGHDGHARGTAMTRKLACSKNNKAFPIKRK